MGHIRAARNYVSDMLHDESRRSRKRNDIQMDAAACIITSY